MVRAYALCDLIPMGFTVSDGALRWECFDCGEELSYATQSSFCEMWLPWTKQRTLDYKAGGAALMYANHIVGRVCLQCAEKRDVDRIEHAHSFGGTVHLHMRHAPKNENTVFRMPTDELGGIRTVCDGRGDWLMTYVVESEERLVSGDVRQHIRATDRAYRQWHGWMRDGFVTLRPYKAKAPRRASSRALVAAE